MSIAEACLAIYKKEETCASPFPNNSYFFNFDSHSKLSCAENINIPLASFCTSSFSIGLPMGSIAVGTAVFIIKLQEILLLFICKLALRILFDCLIISLTVRLNQACSC